MLQAQSEREIIKRYMEEFARKGGKARIAKLNQKQRKELATKAAEARWAKKRSKEAIA
jgi:hypothetical protein